MLITTVFLLVAAATTPPSAAPTPAPAVSLLGAGGTPSQPRANSLADLASRVKLRLPQGSERAITNDSLKSLGAGVELTTSTVATPVDTAAGQAADADETRKQAMWQERYQSARADLDFLEREVPRLEGEVARLATEFYSTDDPARRDGVVKPAWDKALADLESARERLAAARSAPNGVRDEALRDGALPGWFRGLPPPDANPAEEEAEGGGGE